MFPAYVEGEIREVAETASIAPAALLAAAEAIGGGQAVTEVNGRLAPPIEWAPHVFLRRVRPEARAQALRCGLAAPPDAAPEQPRTQRARWALFARARLIDREAAHAAVLWGFGRAPGEAARALGYESAEALADEAMRGPGGQARLLLRRAEQRGARSALATVEWDLFAAAYGFEAADGVERLRRAHARWRSGRPAGAGLRPLALGDTGAAVRILQAALVARGLDTPRDGVFGLETSAAVRRFQMSAGLVVDGVAGGRTLSALGTTPCVRSASDAA